MPPSIHLTLIDAFHTGTVTAFHLVGMPDQLSITFASADHARYFAQRQAKMRDLDKKKPIRLQHHAEDCHEVRIPVQVDHRPHPGVFAVQPVAGADERQFTDAIVRGGFGSM